MLLIKRFVFLLIVLPFMSVAQQTGSLAPHNFIPPNGYVPNSKVAKKVAEAILIEIYGETNIRRQMPFDVTLRDGTWVVQGRLKVTTGRNVFGGVAVIEISKTDGKILRVSHGK